MVLGRRQSLSYLYRLKNATFNLSPRVLAHNLDQSVILDFVLGVRDKESGIQADCLGQHYRSQQDRGVCRATVVKAADGVLRGAAVGSSPDQFCSVV